MPDQRLQIVKRNRDLPVLTQHGLPQPDARAVAARRGLGIHPDGECRLLLPEAEAQLSAFHNGAAAKLRGGSGCIQAQRCAARLRNNPALDRALQQLRRDAGAARVDPRDQHEIGAARRHLG
ncbi:hypothetical protein D3C84_837610 [compost metagenome]